MKKTMATTLALAAAGLAVLLGGKSPSTLTPTTPVIASVNSNFKECADDFFNGTPPTIRNLQELKPREICFKDFAVLHSGTNRSPIYCAEKLNRATLADARDEQRTNQFYEEARLPSVDRAQLASYRGSGWDRGHLCPAAQRQSPESMAQSFSLANIVAQAPTNNRKQWGRSVESAARKYVDRAGADVYMITGPAYDPNITPRYLSGGERIPDFLWKVVLDPTNKKLWAYWIANNDNATPEILDYQEITRRTGINFFTGL